MIGGRIRAGVAAFLAVCLALGPGLETLAATGVDQRPTYAGPAYGGVSDQRPTYALQRASASVSPRIGFGTQPTYERQHASVAASPRVGTDQRPTYERPTYALHSPLGTLDIDVGDVTTVDGALINSETGALDLNTGRLLLSNLHDSDVYDYKSGGFSASVGQGAGLPSVNFDIIEQDKQGITRATISISRSGLRPSTPLVGAGNITIRDVSRDEADALVALANRDPSQFQQVLRDEYHRTVGALDLKALRNLPKNIQTITQALRAFAAPVPDAVAAQGSAAVHLYRQLIFYGAREADAQDFARGPAFSQIVRARKNLAQLAADGTLSLDDRLLALQGEIMLLAGADGINILQMRIDCGLMASDCQVALSDVRRALAEKSVAARAALVASAVQTRGRLAEEAGWGAAAQALQSDLQALMLRCVKDDPLVFAQFARDYPDVARASLGLGGFRDAASLERVVTAIESGARDGALLSVWVANVRADFRAGQALGEMVEETVEGAVGTVKFGYDYATDAQVRAEVSAVISYLYAHPDEAKKLLADAAFGDLLAAYESGNIAALAVKLAPLVVGGGAVLAKLSTKISGGLAARLAKLEGAGEGKWGDGATNKGPKLTIRDHYKHHKDMVTDLKGQLEGQGYRLSDREISFGSSCGNGRCRPDIVYETPDGKLGIIEVKTGNADLTIRQSQIYPQIRDGSSIPRGQVADDFGLDPGVPLRDQGYPNGIPIEITRFPGAG